MGSHLGMEIPNWPPDIEELAKRLEEPYWSFGAGL